MKDRRVKVPCSPFLVYIYLISITYRCTHYLEKNISPYLICSIQKRHRHYIFFFFQNLLLDIITNSLIYLYIKKRTFK